MKPRNVLCKVIVILMISTMLLQPMEVHAYKAGAHAVLSADVAAALPESSVIRRAMQKYPNIVAWGATGPDIPANTAAIVLDRAPWFERYHYEQVGSFVSEQLRLALQSGDEKKIAWAAGWVTHAVGDLYCHGVFVNPDPEVNGVYLDNPDTKEMHGKLEAYADKLLYQDMSPTHEGYNPPNMQRTFMSFDSRGAIELARQASVNTYGMSPSTEDYVDWMDFFKDIYLDTGAAGLTNWVYNYTYKEVSDKLSGGKVPSGRPFAGMTRVERLNRSYSEARAMSVRLLQDAERGIYSGFSDEWNLDAYHQDGRSIGTLTVQIRTSDAEDAGTDDDIWFGIILEDGTQWKSPVLDKSLYNDFERGDNDYYYLFVNSSNLPIRNIRKVFLTKESDGILGGGWKCAYLRATVNGRAIYDGDIHTWLEDDHLTWVGDTTNIVPNRIAVQLSGKADAYTDKIEGTATTSSGPYSGEVNVNIKRKDGSSEIQKVLTNGQGKFSLSLPLGPEDYVSFNVYKPHESIALWTYVGNYEFGYAKVPFESITIDADAFNDIITGEVSGSYTGPMDIVLVRDSIEKVLPVNVSQGVISLSADLVGGDRIYPRLTIEGTDFPREQMEYTPTLSTLELKYSTEGNDINGTIKNTMSKSTKAYTGDVKLSTLVGGLIQTQKAAPGSETGTSGSLKGSLPGRLRKGSSSSYSFKDVGDNLRLGFSITIEHDGIIKGLSYDPLAGVREEANLPRQNAVVSLQDSVINPVVNPAANIANTLGNNLSLAGNMQNPAANITANPGTAGSNMQMMPAQPSAASQSFKGLWMTDRGSLIISGEQGMLKGVYGDGEFTLEGAITGNIFKGNFVEGDRTGIFEFTMNPDGKGFSGRKKYNDETVWNSWNGI